MNIFRAKKQSQMVPDHKCCQLSLDAREAQRAGYGCHYGDYMAAVRDGKRRRKLVDGLPAEMPEPVEMPLPVEAPKAAEPAVQVGKAEVPKRKKKEKPPVPPRFCKQCGKEITAPRRTSFCSGACEVEHNRERSRAYQQAHWRENREREKKNRPPRICIRCGNVIEKAGARAYCSEACAAAAKKEQNAAARAAYAERKKKETA